jgi:hypothetical protein
MIDPGCMVSTWFVQRYHDPYFHISVVYRAFETSVAFENRGDFVLTDTKGGMIEFR